jgi:hypothetical protein
MDAIAPIEKPYVTPANAPNERREMTPLPMRVAKVQIVRLNEARTRTGIAIQEHVRRAIDMYLDHIERQAMELGLLKLAVPSGKPKSNAQPTRPNTQRAVRRPTPKILRK